MSKILFTTILLTSFILNIIMGGYILITAIYESMPSIKMDEVQLYTQAKVLSAYGCSKEEDPKYCMCATNYILTHKTPNEILTIQTNYAKTTEIDQVYFKAMHACTGGVTFGE